MNDVRSIRGAIDDTLARARRAGMRAPADDDPSASDDDATARMFALAESITEELTAVEETLVQTKSKSAQDPLNFPVKLNDKLVSLLYSAEGDYPVTDQARAVFADLSMRIVDQLERAERVMAESIPRFNRAVADAEVPAIPMPEDAESSAPSDAGAVAPSGRD